MNPRWHLSHARGYLELGMEEEAAAELARLPPDDPENDDVLALRAVVLQEQQRWAELRNVTGELLRRQPQTADWWIMCAYATRRAVSIIEAEAVLREAELRHPQEPTIQFNLGCYACLRGDLPEARHRVDRAIALDKRFRDAARTDPDLAALHQADA